MTLQVYTARVSYGGPDRFDVTRRSGGVAGEPFAPSWAILKTLLEARNRWRETKPSFVDRVIEEGDLWNDYVFAYRDEMRASYRRNRPAWDALLSRDEVTLCCYCTDPYKCHRTLLANMLGMLGAVVRGEARG